MPWTTVKATVSIDLLDVNGHLDISGDIEGEYTAEWGYRETPNYYDWEPIGCIVTVVDNNTNAPQTITDVSELQDLLPNDEWDRIVEDGVNEGRMEQADAF